MDRGLDPRRELRLRLCVHAVIDAHVPSAAVLALDQPFGARCLGISLETRYEILHDCRLGHERVELGVGGVEWVRDRDVDGVASEEARGLEQAIVVDQRDSLDLGVGRRHVD